MSTSPVSRIMASFDAVNDAYNRGTLDSLPSGITRIKRAIKELYSLESSNTGDALAYCHGLLFMLLLDAGRVDEALDVLPTAGNLYEAALSGTPTQAMFLHDVTVALHELGAPSEVTLHFGRRARSAMDRTGLLKGRFGRLHEFDRYLQSIELDGEGGSQLPAIRSLRRRYRWSRGQSRVDAAQALAVTLLQQGDRSSKAVVEIHRCLNEAFRGTIAAPNRLDAATIALGTLLDLHSEGIAWPIWALDAALELAQVARTRGRLDLASVGNTVAGLDLARNGRPADALRHLLLAVAQRDEYALSTETSWVRGLRARPTEYARQFAIEAALTLGDFKLVAELIESARLQVLPIPESGPGHGSRIGNLRPLAWEGRSCIAPFYDTVGVPIELRDWVVRIGGQDACWLGTWAANENLYWCWFGDGRLQAGSTRINDGGPVADLLLEAFQSTPANHAEVDLYAGVWTRSSFVEEMTARDVGETVLPEPALDWLRSRAADRTVGSLVVSGSLFALIPPALLGFSTSGPSGDPAATRLIEVAVVRVAPPAILVTRLRAREASIGHTGLRPVLVACVNPTSDLSNATYEPDAVTALIGSNTIAAEVPTLQRLVAALSRIDPGEDGIFYYSGHTFGGSGDSEDALVLADRETLSADEIFNSASQDGGLAFPETAIVSACSSAGAHGAGAGEWLGLSAAMLYAGANQVICTAWPIWDNPFTRQFDERLTSLTQRLADPAVALRELQLESLAEWRASDHDFGEKVDLRVIGRLPYPLIWAAFMSVGVARGRMDGAEQPIGRSPARTR
jgi:hypothetical protein